MGRARAGLAEVTSDRPVDGPGPVVVGTDGSPQAQEAVRQAAMLAVLRGASLEVIHVLDRGQPHARPPSEDLGARADEVLDEAAAVAGAERVEAGTRLLAGDPAGVLVEEATERGAGLLCVGPDAGMLSVLPRVGRVAARVLREAPCSVLLARCPEWAGRSAFPRRIVVGIDGSPPALEAVRQAVGIAAAGGAELHLLHVAAALDGGVMWMAEGDAGDPVVIESAVAEARAAEVEARTVTAAGPPGPMLAEGVRRVGADLLVVGSRGLRGLPRILLGTVSEWVAVHAPCSVLVARPREA